MGCRMIGISYILDHGLLVVQGLLLPRPQRLSRVDEFHRKIWAFIQTNIQRLFKGLPSLLKNRELFREFRLPMLEEKHPPMPRGRRKTTVLTFQMSKAAGKSLRQVRSRFPGRIECQKNCKTRIFKR